MSDTQTARSRLLSIDLLRGVAILWVVLFHLWADFEVLPWSPRFYYEQFWHSLRDGNADVVTRFSDLVLRLGYQGVPLFMILSGLSLTLAASRAPAPPALIPFAVSRVRKIMPLYWFGFAYTMVVILILAGIQQQLWGGGYWDQFQHHITFGRFIWVPLDWGYVLAGLTLVPRVLNEKWMYAPESVLWFVPLLLQYYLLFPLLFRLLRRTGPLPFAAITAAIGIGVQVVAIAVWNEYTVAHQVGWIIAPTRLIEFTGGMALAGLMVSPDSGLQRFAGTPARAAGVLVLALVAHTAGSMLTEADGYRYTLSSTLIVVGLCGMCAPLLLVQRPVEAAGVALGWLATTGAASYAVLVVNEPLRYIMSLLRLETPDVVWKPVLAVVYIPGSIVLAVPLARFFGLMPRRARRVVEPEPPRTLAEPGALPAQG